MPPALLSTISNSWSFCSPEEKPLHPKAEQWEFHLKSEKDGADPGKQVAENWGAMALGVYLVSAHSKSLFMPEGMGLKEGSSVFTIL